MLLLLTNILLLDHRPTKYFCLFFFTLDSQMGERRVHVAEVFYWSLDRHSSQQGHSISKWYAVSIMWLWLLCIIENSLKFVLRCLHFHISSFVSQQDPAYQLISLQHHSRSQIPKVRWWTRQLGQHLALKMTYVLAIKASATNNGLPGHSYPHPDNHNQ